jgi:hypothetical protein
MQHFAIAIALMHACQLEMQLRNKTQFSLQGGSE